MAISSRTPQEAGMNPPRFTAFRNSGTPRIEWNWFLCGALLGVVSVFAIAACSSSENSAPPHDPIAAPESVMASEGQEGGCQATGRLRELWEKRTSEGQTGDYPVGPGDVLRITMADLPEVKNLDSRVSGEGR